jgi:tol-pal system beta propeller repeat protein TolB
LLTTVALIPAVFGCALAQTNPVIAGNSPQPFRLAFARKRTHATYTYETRSWLFTMDSDGRNVRDLKLEGFSPSWSPDGNRIAFSSSKDEPRAEVYVCNADGSHTQRLTHLRGGAGADRPVWSPDGKQIAFSSFVGKLPEIFVVDIDGSEPKKLTGGGGISPSWSPDGKKIVFASARGGSLQLYWTNADGTGVAQLTTVKPGASEPAWSPDGNKILYTVTGLQSESTIGILDVPSGKTSRFAYSDKFNFFSPAWSPDSKMVLMELSGKGGFVVWSPDPYEPPAEKAIGWKHQIFAMTIDGALSRQLTKADDGGTQPSAGKMP